MIEARALSFAYPGGRETLIEIDFRVDTGELALLAGANGAGKSTLLAVLAGLFAPGSGEAVVAGLRLPGQDAAVRAAAALVLQDAEAMLLGATALEDLTLDARPGDPAAEEAARAMARRFGLEESLRVPVQHLSHGQKRKLSLAGALLRRPRVLLLDEPFAGLDYAGILEMRAILRENASAGLTQVVAAHDLDPAADLAQNLTVLSQGRTVLHGPPAEVLDQVAGFGVRPPCSWLAARRLASWEGA